LKKVTKVRQLGEGLSHTTIRLEDDSSLPDRRINFLREVVEAGHYGNFLHCNGIPFTKITYFFDKNLDHWVFQMET
jgi:hypothetical protein